MSAQNPIPYQFERAHIKERSKIRLSSQIQSIAISESGDRAVALVNHDHVYCLDLSDESQLSDAECWIVPRPAIKGNRCVEMRDSAVVFSGEDQVHLCHVTGWRSDPKNQINIQRLDLRTGEILYECNVPAQISFQCTAIRLSEELLLVGCSQDAVIVELSESRSVGTLRETLWESEIWDTDEDKPWEDDAMPRQGLVLDPGPGTIHALFDQEDKAFVESYRWHNREGCFKCVKRQTIRESRAGALCIGPTGALGVWMTNPREDIPLPPGGVEAIEDAKLGRMVFLNRGKRRQVEVRSGEDDDFEMMIMEAASKGEQDVLRIGTAQQAAFPFFSSTTTVILNTPAGRMMRVDQKGSVDELHRCERPITAAAWSANTGRLLIGSGANGWLTLLQFEPIKPSRTKRAVPKPTISKKKGAGRVKKPANVRRAEKRIRDMVADDGTAVFLTDMQLTEFPDLLFETKSWERLGFYLNRITQIPEEFTSFSKLRELQADNNALRTLPSWIGRLRKLREVTLSHNEIAELPASFGELSRLRKLKLDYNPLGELPASFGNLKGLRILWLDHCRLKRLPDSFQNLTDLRELELSDCPLGTFPSQLEFLTKLTSLGLDGTGIRELPDWLDKLNRLQYLHLNRNAITHIPESIRAMSKLRSLNLCYCPIASLPSWIGEMQSLQNLDLCQCKKLVSLPSEIGRIERVHLHGTSLEKHS